MTKSKTGGAATRDEIAAMAERAGLNLSPEHFDQLCDAWKHVEQMVARIPRDRPRMDEPAHTFVARRIRPNGD